MVQLYTQEERVLTIFTVTSGTLIALNLVLLGCMFKSHRKRRRVGSGIEDRQSVHEMKGPLLKETLDEDVNQPYQDAWSISETHRPTTSTPEPITSTPRNKRSHKPKRKRKKDSHRQTLISPVDKRPTTTLLKMLIEDDFKNVTSDLSSECTISSGLASINNREHDFDSDRPISVTPRKVKLQTIPELQNVNEERMKRILMNKDDIHRERTMEEVNSKAISDYGFSIDKNSTELMERKRNRRSQPVHLKPLYTSNITDVIELWNKVYARKKSKRTRHLRKNANDIKTNGVRKRPSSVLRGVDSPPPVVDRPRTSLL